MGGTGGGATAAWCKQGVVLGGALDKRLPTPTRCGDAFVCFVYLLPACRVVGACVCVILCLFCYGCGTTVLFVGVPLRWSLNHVSVKGATYTRSDVL